MVEIICGGYTTILFHNSPLNSLGKIKKVLPVFQRTILVIFSVTVILPSYVKGTHFGRDLSLAR